MADTTLEFRGIGSSGLELVPGEMLERRQCSRCLHWEASDFWTGNDAPEILETRKRNWFRRVSAEFDPCALAAVENGSVVGYAQFALPKHFPGLEEAEVRPEPDIPFIACFVVAPEHQGRGVGKGLLEAVESSLRERGFPAVQTIAPEESRKNPSGPASFWQAHGFREAGKSGGSLLLRKDL